MEVRQANAMTAEQPKEAASLETRLQAIRQSFNVPSLVITLVVNPDGCFVAMALLPNQQPLEPDEPENDEPEMPFPKSAMRRRLKRKKPLFYFG